MHERRCRMAAPALIIGSLGMVCVSHAAFYFEECRPGCHDYLYRRPEAAEWRVLWA